MLRQDHSGFLITGQSLPLTLPINDHGLGSSSYLAHGYHISLRGHTTSFGRYSERHPSPLYTVYLQRCTSESSRYEGDV